VTDRAERLQRRLDPVLFVAAMLTVPVLVIQASDAGHGWDVTAEILNWAIWATFAGAAVALLWVTPDRRRWLREHPLDVAIVLFTAPILPASLEAARVFRLLPVLRLVGAVVLARRMLSTEGVRDAAILAMMTVLGGGAAYSAVETGPDGQALSTWDGVWWAITTVTTVGYGDNYPHTTEGRIIAIAVMAVGIGFVALITASAAERITRARRAEASELSAVSAKLDEILRRLDALEKRG